MCRRISQMAPKPASPEAIGLDAKKGRSRSEDLPLKTYDQSTVSAA